MNLESEQPLEELAILLAAADSLLEGRFDNADEAVGWARDVFEYLESSPVWANGRHDGDCSDQIHICLRCFVEEHREAALKWAQGEGVAPLE